MIDIKYKPTEYPITVYGGWFEGTDFLIDWCNHAGAEEVPDTAFQMDHDHNGEILMRTVYTWAKVCDKCGASYDPRYGNWDA